MKRLLILLALGLTACATGVTQLGTYTLNVGGKNYVVNRFKADSRGFYSYRGSVIYYGGEPLREVQVDGIWYLCESSCEFTVENVLASKTAKLPQVRPSQAVLPPNPTKLLETGGEGGDGEGGGGGGY